MHNTICSTTYIIVYTASFRTREIYTHMYTTLYAEKGVCAFCAECTLHGMLWSVGHQTRSPGALANTHTPLYALWNEASICGNTTAHPHTTGWKTLRGLRTLGGGCGNRQALCLFFSGRGGVVAFRWNCGDGLWSTNDTWVPSVGKKNLRRCGGDDGRGRRAAKTFWRSMMRVYREVYKERNFVVVCARVVARKESD